MARQRKTDEQASRDNARKWNEKQVASVPLYAPNMTTQQLSTAGLVTLREEDAQLRSMELYRAKIARVDKEMAYWAEVYRLGLRRADLTAYREALLKLRRLQLKTSAMRQSHMKADYWHSALKKALPLDQLKALYAEIAPDTLAHLEMFEQINQKTAEKLARNGFQPSLFSGKRSA